MMMMMMMNNEGGRCQMHHAWQLNIESDSTFNVYDLWACDGVNGGYVMMWCMCLCRLESHLVKRIKTTTKHCTIKYSSPSLTFANNICYSKCQLLAAKNTRLFSSCVKD